MFWYGIFLESEKAKTHMISLSQELDKVEQSEFTFQMLLVALQTFFQDELSPSPSRL